MTARQTVRLRGSAASATRTRRRGREQPSATGGRRGAGIACESPWSRVMGAERLKNAARQWSVEARPAGRMTPAGRGRATCETGREGFEPPRPCGPPVFKTGAFNHSATCPIVRRGSAGERSGKSPLGAFRATSRALKESPYAASGKTSMEMRRFHRYAAVCPRVNHKGNYKWNPLSAQGVTVASAPRCGVREAAQHRMARRPLFTQHLVGYVPPVMSRMSALRMCSKCVQRCLRGDGRTLPP